MENKKLTEWKYCKCKVCRRIKEKDLKKSIKKCFSRSLDSAGLSWRWGIINYDIANDYLEKAKEYINELKD